MNITFDTYDLVLILKQKGFDENQAVGIIEAIKHSHGNLVTKQDLESGINQLDNKIIQLEYKMIIKIGSMFIAMTGVLIAVLKFWH